MKKETLWEASQAPLKREESKKMQLSISLHLNSEN